MLEFNEEYAIVENGDDVSICVSLESEVPDDFSVDVTFVTSGGHGDNIATGRFGATMLSLLSPLFPCIPLSLSHLLLSRIHSLLFAHSSI